MDRESLQEEFHEFLVERGLLDVWKQQVTDNGASSINSFLNEEDINPVEWGAAGNCTCASCQPNRKLAGAAKDWKFTLIKRR